MSENNIASIIRIGERPKPRVLVVVQSDRWDSVERKRFPSAEWSNFGFPTFLDGLNGLCPTVEVVFSTELHKIRQGDFDGVFSFGTSMAEFEPHLYCVCFGGTHVDAFRDHDGLLDQIAVVHASRDGQSVATHWTIDDDPARGAGVRLRQELELVLSRSHPKTTLSFQPGFAAQAKMLPPGKREFVSLVFDDDGQSICGYWLLSNGGERWTLPMECDPLTWAQFLLKRWHGLDAARFPRVSRWEDVREYQSSDERRAISRLTALKSELAELVRANADETAAAELALQSARSVASTSFRRLVVEQGDDLVAIVTTALERLGFLITNSDKDAVKGDKLEDLQARHPDDMEWVTLIEVRGYSGGAKVNDLARINRFAGRYEGLHGRAPNAAWYIVNGFMGKDPDTRESPLRSNPAEVESFASDVNGLVIDTADLLRVWLAVESGELTAEKARSSLVNASGSWCPEIL